MKKILKINATSIVEAMVVMLIVVTGVVGMYNILTKSTQLTTNVKNKIQAIQIARQGIEAFTNIRDTNWILFSSDYLNCWNVLNYNPQCIGDDGGINDTDGNATTYDIKENQNYKIYLNEDNRWILENTSNFTPNNFSNSDYRNFFKVGLNNGIYTQSGITEELIPFYTREIKVNYLQEDGITNGNESDPKIKISSIVQRIDNTSSQAHKIVIEQVLSNWKSKK
ncbi:MAG: hypothetical protein PHS49_01595 [Candidatus Gracilibacteria bacterium]|nr:hypothetical protein [Candidatus Gracilibacteria bacterium]